MFRLQRPGKNIKNAKSQITCLANYSLTESANLMLSKHKANMHTTMLQLTQKYLRCCVTAQTAKKFQL